MTVTQLLRSDEYDPRIAGDGHAMGHLTCSEGILPLRAMGYDCTVRCLGVETRILQTFYNPFDFPIEATYVFPLSGTAAVTDCVMLVDDRVVRADLEERSVARRRYKDAIHAGHRAALLEENRSETFSISVGNIPAGHSVRIFLSTVDELEVQNDQWLLRLPLVVAPRYTSGMPLPALGDQSGQPESAPGTAMNTNEVPDASQVTPARIVSGFPNPVELTISVDIHLASLMPDQPWSEILSSSLHSVIATEKADHCKVSIAAGERANRDFILRGSLKKKPLSVSSRMSSLVTETTAESRHPFALHIHPPEISVSCTPKRVVVLLDQSSSMNGWKFPAAQRAACQLIESLGKNDQFGLFAFNTTFTCFESDYGPLHQATKQNLFRANKWTMLQPCTGGTEMAAALAAGLQCFESATESSYENSIVLITDGQITGEDNVLSQLRNLPPGQRPRIFAVGVDRAVNASVLRRLSNATDGIFELAESENQLDKALETVCDLIGGPVLRSIQVENMDHTDLEIAAAKKSLFRNRPFTLYGRSSAKEFQLKISGIRPDDSDWSETVDVKANGQAHSDLLALWGKARIRNLEDQYAINSVDDAELRSEIVQTSLDTRTLSRFTAYIAVDEEQIDSTQAPTRINQLVDYPEGWFEKSWGPIDEQDRVSSAPAPVYYQRSDASPKQQYDSISESVTQQIGKRLIKQGTLSAEQWKEALNSSKASGKHCLISLTNDLKYINADMVARLLSQISNKVYVDLASQDVSEIICELVPETVARENCIIPIGENGNNLVVAMTSPYDLDTIENLRFILNRDIEIAIATGEAIQETINRKYGQIEGESADSILQEFSDTAIDFTETVVDDESGTFESPGDAAIVLSDSEQDELITAVPSNAIRRLVQLMLSEAVQVKASKIRIWLCESSIVVEYTVDGHVQERDRLPLSQWEMLIAAIREITKGCVEVAPHEWSATLTIAVGGNQKTAHIQCRPSELMISLDGEF